LRIKNSQSQFSSLGLRQATDFFPFAGLFRPDGEKDLQEKESTMLPQAAIAFA
jgi:hypothetical protein